MSISASECLHELVTRKQKKRLKCLQTDSIVGSHHWLSPHEPYRHVSSIDFLQLLLLSGFLCRSGPSAAAKVPLTNAYTSEAETKTQKRY